MDDFLIRYAINDSLIIIKICIKNINDDIYKTILVKKHKVTKRNETTGDTCFLFDSARQALCYSVGVTD